MAESHRVRYSAMKTLARCALLLVAAVRVLPAAADAEAQIKAVLAAQVDAWNRGDIPAFVTSYASDAIMVSKEIARGREQIRARYERVYATREQMGHLSFGAIEVRMLTPDVAFITGEWRVDRATGSQSHLGGLFSLVVRRHDKQWKIALDHTS